MSQPGGYTIAPGAEWTNQASTWPVLLVTRETEPGHFLTDIVPVTPQPALTQIHLACAKCDDYPSVFCLIPDIRAVGYIVNTAELLAGILAHIRRSHSEVVAS